VLIRKLKREDRRRIALDVIQVCSCHHGHRVARWVQTKGTGPKKSRRSLGQKRVHLDIESCIRELPPAFSLKDGLIECKKREINKSPASRERFELLVNHITKKHNIPYEEAKAKATDRLMNRRRTELQLHGNNMAAFKAQDVQACKEFNAMIITSKKCHLAIPLSAKEVEEQNLANVDPNTTNNRPLPLWEPADTNLGAQQQPAALHASSTGVLPTPVVAILEGDTGMGHPPDTRVQEVEDVQDEGQPGPAGAATSYVPGDTLDTTPQTRARLHRERRIQKRRKSAIAGRVQLGSSGRTGTAYPTV